MVTSDLRVKVEIWPFPACAMYPAIIIQTAWSLWTWLWGRYHVPQNVFLVIKFTHGVMSFILIFCCSLTLMEVRTLAWHPSLV